VNELTPSAAATFLEEPLVATFATYRRDGSVLLSPVWHEWTGALFHVLVDRDNIKVKHVRHDPRASIVVYENAPPYRGVEASGITTLTDVAYDEILARIGARYLPGGLPAGLAPDGLVLELRPGRMRSWSLASWFPVRRLETR
jgi:PPOX class probable F420-dependent enzyme